MSHIPDIQEKQTVKGVEARNIFNFRTREDKHNRFYSLAGQCKTRTMDYGPQTTDYRLRTTDNVLRTTDYGLQTRYKTRTSL